MNVGRKVGSAELRLDVEAVEAGEAALVLVRHCRDMKRQETSLRVVTLLLLLTCSSLFFISTCADLKQRRHQSPHDAAVGSPAYSTQEKLCPTENSQTEASKMYIDLFSVPGDSSTEPLALTWKPVIGHGYDNENRSIVIPTTGIYFVYMKFDLCCYNSSKHATFSKFWANLNFWSPAYRNMQTLAEEKSGVNCYSERSRSFSTGQLYDLYKGDHLSVWITHGYGLICKSSFGAFQI